MKIKPNLTVGVIFLVAAAMFLSFALIVSLMADGNLMQSVEIRIPRRRGRGSGTTVSYPAFIPVLSAVGYAISMILVAVANFVGSLKPHLVGAVLAMIVAVWSLIDGWNLGIDGASKFVALAIPASAIFISIALYQRSRNEAKRTPPIPPYVP